MIRLVISALLMLVLALPAFAEDSDFVSWWKQVATPEQFKQGENRYYHKLLKLKFTGLEEYRGPVGKPTTISKGIENVFVLFSDKRSTILLAAPKDITKGMEVGSEAFYAAYSKCSGDKAWLVLLPENRWTEVEVNPYCSESYGPDEIDILLYWAAGHERPFVEFVTNGPACIPGYLYGFEKKTRRYRLLAEQCGG